MNGHMTIGDLSARTGVPVKALREYTDLGLIYTLGRSPAGYRLYTDADLARLATVVTYRRLDLPLDEVKALLDGDGTPEEHLRRQRAVVVSRLDELAELVTAIDRALEREMEQQPATTEDLKELFGDGFGEEYAAEAEERWGDTEEWKQSQARTSQYTKEDWLRLKAEMDDLNARLGEAFTSGVDPGSEQAMDLAEEHRQQITGGFYDCSLEMHRGLGEMYVADPRFTATYDAVASGLAPWLRDAIAANADRQEAAGAQ